MLMAPTCSGLVRAASSHAWGVVARARRVSSSERYLDALDDRVAPVRREVMDLCASARRPVDLDGRDAHRGAETEVLHQARAREVRRAGGHRARLEPGPGPQTDARAHGVAVRAHADEPEL